MPAVAGNVGRDIKNSPNMLRHVFKLGGTIEKMAICGLKAVIVHGINGLDTGMIRVKMPNAPVGGCAGLMRATSGPDDTHTRTKPCDRWFADALVRVNVDDTTEHFAEAAACI